MIQGGRTGGGGIGGGRGTGGGGGQGGGGGGRGGGRGFGPGGECVCSACGHVAPHQPGQPCFQMKCPKCGAVMIRKD
ncbi:hypothetical protein K9N50_01085 [bacterium]|nr:hypothetical protein [bacterium]